MPEINAATSKQLNYEIELLAILGSLAAKNETVTVAQLAQRAMDRIAELELLLSRK